MMSPVRAALRRWQYSILLLAYTVPALAESAAFKVGDLGYSNIVSGLAYAHLQLTNLPLSVHIARLNRSHRELAIVSTLAQDRIQGLAPLSKQVAALADRQGRPLVAINGDFFAIRPGPYQGDPGGLQIRDGELVSAPTDKAFWITRDGKPNIGLSRSRMEVRWPGGAKTRLGLNEAPWTNAATLFTSTFGKTTCATNEMEVVLECVGDLPWLPLRIQETYRARVRELRPHGNSALLSNQMVLTINGTAATNLATLQTEDILTLNLVANADIQDVETSIGGQPILLQNGEIQPWPSRRGILDHLQPRHPRTAVGFNERFVFFIAVDGRQPDLSSGLSFVELTSLMQQLGCTDALNLDGGGSTTFWLNGQVVSSPSDKRERSLANGLVIVQRPD